MQRLFIAIDFPDAVKDELKRLCSGLSGAKWVRHEQMHLTLRFIGEVDESKGEAIKSALSNIQAAPFTMILEGVGQFPPKGKARVLWVGVKAPSDLSKLQQQIESTLLKLGLDPADHAFSPHITLARFKMPPEAETMREYFAQNSNFQSETISVKAFILFSSLLSHEGPTYEREGVYELRS